jgi:hypothetical protein
MKYNFNIMYTVWYKADYAVCYVAYTACTYKLSVNT